MTRRAPDGLAIGLVALALGLAAALAAPACRKQEERAPAARPAVIGEAELKRGRDACGAYLEQVCACARTVPAAQHECELAKALPESIEVATDVAAHPETERKDAVQLAAAARKAIARCIEQTAKLPELGCTAPGPKR
jgi:hypothetical protein